MAARPGSFFAKPIGTAMAKRIGICAKTAQPPCSTTYQKSYQTVPLSAIEPRSIVFLQMMEIATVRPKNANRMTGVYIAPPNRCNSCITRSFDISLTSVSHKGLTPARLPPAPAPVPASTRGTLPRRGDRHRLPQIPCETADPFSSSLRKHRFIQRFLMFENLNHCFAWQPSASCLPAPQTRYLMTKEYKKRAAKSIVPRLLGTSAQRTQFVTFYENQYKCTVIAPYPAAPPSLSGGDTCDT